MEKREFKSSESIQNLQEALLKAETKEDVLVIARKLIDWDDNEIKEDT